LGYRSGTRTTPTGINVRESDVARTFAHMIDHIIALAPDVVVAAGDLFDRVNPGNPAITHANNQLARLRAALPATIVVLISGNHESPNESGQGCILPLFATLGVHVVDRAAQRLRFGELSILCVPDCPGIQLPALAPDPSARFNLLLLHGEVEGMPRGGGSAKGEISKDQVGAAAWDYIALGHYHVAQEIAPNCWYAGSIDRTSTDPWGEMRAEAKAGLVGKGFILRDLETGAHEFHPLPVSRRYIDLPAIDATGLGVEELNAAIAATVEAADIDDAVVRLVVREVDRIVRRGLDQRVIRSCKRRALNFNLDVETAEVVRDESSPSVRLRGMSTRDLIVEALGRRALPADVDRAALEARALDYLEQAGEAMPAETVSIAAAARERVA
jgi:DNA repair exonuclease SbcCD nuclease subunit